jgi:hypothetical protein
MSNPERNIESTQWSWWQFAIALGLIPLSCIMFWFGLGGVWQSDTPPPIDPNPGWTLICNVLMRLAPFVALASVIWILALIWIGFRPQRARSKHGSRHDR